MLHSMNEIPHRLDLWTFTRFVDKPRFVDGFLGNEKSTNRVMHCISISILATFENIKNSIIDDVEMCVCTEAFVKIEIF